MVNSTPAALASIGLLALWMGFFGACFGVDRPKQKAKRHPASLKCTPSPASFLDEGDVARCVLSALGSQLAISCVAVEDDQSPTESYFGRTLYMNAAAQAYHGNDNCPLTHTFSLYGAGALEELWQHLSAGGFWIACLRVPPPHSGHHLAMRNQHSQQPEEALSASSLHGSYSCSSSCSDDAQDDHTGGICAPGEGRMFDRALSPSGGGRSGKAQRVSAAGAAASAAAAALEQLMEPPLFASTPLTSMASFGKSGIELGDINGSFLHSLDKLSSQRRRRSPQTTVTRPASPNGTDYGDLSEAGGLLQYCPPSPSPWLDRPQQVTALPPSTAGGLHLSAVRSLSRKSLPGVDSTHALASALLQQSPLSGLTDAALARRSIASCEHSIAGSASGTAASSCMPHAQKTDSVTSSMTGNAAGGFPPTNTSPRKLLSSAHSASSSRVISFLQSAGASQNLGNGSGGCRSTHPYASHFGRSSTGHNSARFSKPPSSAAVSGGHLHASMFSGSHGLPPYRGSAEVLPMLGREHHHLGSAHTRRSSTSLALHTRASLDASKLHPHARLDLDAAHLHEYAALLNSNHACSTPITRGSSGLQVQTSSGFVGASSCAYTFCGTSGSGANSRTSGDNRSPRSPAYRDGDFPEFPGGRSSPLGRATSGLGTFDLGFLEHMHGGSQPSEGRDDGGRGRGAMGISHLLLQTCPADVTLEAADAATDTVAAAGGDSCGDKPTVLPLSGDFTAAPESADTATDDDSCQLEDDKLGAGRKHNMLLPLFASEGGHGPLVPVFPSLGSRPPSAAAALLLRSGTSFLDSGTGLPSLQLWQSNLCSDNGSIAGTLQCASVRSWGAGMPSLAHRQSPGHPTQTAACVRLGSAAKEAGAACQEEPVPPAQQQQQAVEQQQQPIELRPTPWTHLSKMFVESQSLQKQSPFQQQQQQPPSQLTLPQSSTQLELSPPTPARHTSPPKAAPLVPVVQQQQQLQLQAPPPPLRASLSYKGRSQPQQLVPAMGLATAASLQRTRSGGPPYIGRSSAGGITSTTVPYVAASLMSSQNSLILPSSMHDMSTSTSWFTSKAIVELAEMHSPAGKVAPLHEPSDNFSSLHLSTNALQLLSGTSLSKVLHMQSEAGPASARSNFTSSPPSSPRGGHAANGGFGQFSGNDEAAPASGGGSGRKRTPGARNSAGAVGLFSSMARALIASGSASGNNVAGSLPANQQAATARAAPDGGATAGDASDRSVHGNGSAQAVSFASGPADYPRTAGSPLQMTVDDAGGGKHTQGQQKGARKAQRLADAGNKSKPGGMRGPAAAAQSVCWHEVSATLIAHPATGKRMLVLRQTDVTDKLLADQQLALVLEREHRMLEQIFPRHVLEYCMLGPIEEPLPVEYDTEHLPRHGSGPSTGIQDSATFVHRPPAWSSSQLEHMPLLPPQRALPRRPGALATGEPLPSLAETHRMRSPLRLASCTQMADLAAATRSSHSNDLRPDTPQRRRASFDSRDSRPSQHAAEMAAAAAAAGGAAEPPRNAAQLRRSGVTYSDACNDLMAARGSTASPQRTVLRRQPTMSAAPLQLMPQGVVGRLATSHRHVTLMFADVVSFTPLCSQLSPSTVMCFLNQLFCSFDGLLEEHDVYKVETIGDCYVVAGGLMRRDEGGCMSVCADADAAESATKVVRFAKAMLREAAKVRLPTNGQVVQMRVGVHSGPIVSGVVGTAMPRFSLFGDTINTTARMESTSAPGCIHASDATFRLLPADVRATGDDGGRDEGWHGEWDAMDQIEVKGKGLMDTFMWRPIGKQAKVHTRGPEAQLGFL